MTKKENGLSLIDIGEATERIPHGETSITVHGLSAKSLLFLMQRFPLLRDWASGAGFQMTDLITVSPEILAAVIAAACGGPGDEDVEAVAGRLGAETQLDILEAIGRLTFKSGFGPFVHRITVLADALVSANSGKASGTKSPPVSSPSLPPGTEAAPSGS